MSIPLRTGMPTEQGGLKKNAFRKQKAKCEGQPFALLGPLPETAPKK